MGRHIILGIIAFVVVFAPAYWMFTTQDRRMLQEEQASGEVLRLLEREAEIVAHFCLSRIPPVPKAAIPSEWEQALGSSIKLREGAGEITSEAPELAARATEIQNLEIGEFVGVSSVGGTPSRYWIIHRPAAASNQLLVLSKTGEMAAKQLHEAPRSSALMRAFLLSLIAAVVITVATRFVFPPAKPEAA